VAQGGRLARGADRIEAGSVTRAQGLSRALDRGHERLAGELGAADRGGGSGARRRPCAACWRAWRGGSRRRAGRSTPHFYVAKGLPFCDGAHPAIIFRMEYPRRYLSRSLSHSFGHTSPTHFPTAACQIPHPSCLLIILFSQPTQEVYCYLSIDR
jgi:hypothetical protein